MENATILYLVNNTEESFNELKESLGLLKNNFLNDFPYPVTIFKEEGFNPGWEEEIKKIYQEVDFILIEFNIPEFNRHLDIPEFTPHPTHANGPVAWGHPGFNLGYRHMCRFMSGDMFRNESILKYDWYCRLDTDSFILSRVGFDFFSKMQEEGFLYGFNEIQEDNPKVVEGLFESSEEYMRAQGIIKKSDVIYPKMYYTNFEIAKVSWFLSSGYMDYFDHIDSIGGIYTKRWGDAPIRYIGVKSLMEDRNILDFRGLINYKHGCHREFEKHLSYTKK
jgi:alpha 1,2-mannosyltransferase